MPVEVVRVTPILVVTALLGATFALAQPTIRLEPEPVIFPDSQTFSVVDVSIFVDNIPEPGLRGFNITLDSRARGSSGPACVTHHPADLGTLDADLTAAWNGNITNLVVRDEGTEVQWRASGVSSTSNPTGTVRLGSLRFRVALGNLPDGCFIGMQDNFRWDQAATTWRTGSRVSTPFSVYRNAPWILVNPPSVDLSASCTRTSPADPNVFVDGDLLTLDCTVSNSGPSPTQVIPTFVAVFSQDETVDSGDREIATSRESGTVAGHGTSNVVVSARPVLVEPQVINICTRIDVDPNDLDNLQGEIYETDDSNNTECQPISVLEPQRDLVPVAGSGAVMPDPVDPNGQVRAGLRFQVSFGVLNQGVAAVRQDHVDAVYLGDTLQAGMASSPGGLCSLPVSSTGVLPLAGDATVTHSFGLGPLGSSSTCKVPFDFPEGPTSLWVVLDDGNSVVEQDPNFSRPPAEANNVMEIPLEIRKPLDPQIRVQHRASPASDHIVELFGPGTGTMLLSVASARGLTAYGLQLRWDPPGLITVGDPNVSGGDPNGVEFLGFLEEGGRTQSCSVDAIDPAAGTLDLSCTTTDPNGGAAAASSEASRPLARVTWTTLLPGAGTFTLGRLSALDGGGQPYTGLRKIDGAFTISGTPEISVLSPVSPARVYPGAPFSASWDILNDGFGTKQPPLLTELVISRNGVLETGDPNSPDFRACFLGESSSLPGKTRVSRTATGCSVPENVRPGNYTGFYQVQLGLDPNRGATDLIPLPSRLVALRKTGRGKVADTFGAPVQPGDTVGPRLARGRGFRARSLASVGSAERNRNWIIGLGRSRGGKKRLRVFDLPLEPRKRLEQLRTLRVPGEDKRVLGSADIDGDGDEELIILQRRKKVERLDFRRIDFGKLFPLICQSAAETGPFGERVLGATGIQFDTDPEDELAVATADGALTIYDIALTGALPPARPCDTVPVLLIEPAVADLMPLASDPAFGGTGEEVRSLCAMDDALDGTEEIAALFTTGGKAQAVRIFQPPAGPGGAAVLVADDPAFGGTGGRPRSLDLSCTR